MNATTLANLLFKGAQAINAKHDIAAEADLLHWLNEAQQAADEITVDVDHQDVVNNIAYLADVNQTLRNLSRAKRNNAERAELRRQIFRTLLDATKDGGVVTITIDVLLDNTVSSEQALHEELSRLITKGVISNNNGEYQLV